MNRDKHPKVIRTSTVALSLNFLLKGQLSFLNKQFEVVAVSGEDEHLKNVEKREGVRSVNIPMKRAINPIHDFISLCRLFWLFKKERPQIVHSITPKAGLLSMTAAYFAGVPIRMHMFTGLIFPTRTGVMKKVLIIMDKILCMCATNVYPEGNGVKNDLIKYNITNKPLKVLGNGNVNGIDLNYYSADKIPSEQKIQLKRNLNISEKDFVFIFVGRLVGDKGINELVEAFVNLKRDNVKLLLVGPFETESDPLLPTTLKEIEQNSEIITVGFQTDVRIYFAIADVLAFPSYREGFPNVVLQAGAMELPSIVSDINGSNEIILDGENGTIVPAKDSEALLIAMENMIDNQDYHNQLKSKTRSMIHSRYEQKVIWNAVLDEYKQLIKMHATVKK